MLEEAIYSISNHFTQLIVFLGFVLLLGIIIYIMTGKFDIHKKTSMYCGLLTGLNKKQILALCVILIRTFCIIYAVTIYSKNIGLSLVTIFLIDCIFILLSPKKILFEGINIIAQLIFIYLINVLKTYGLSFKYILTTLFVDKNFYGHTYPDSGSLEDILEFRSDSMSSYYMRLKRQVKGRKLAKIFAKPIVIFLNRKNRGRFTRILKKPFTIFHKRKEK